MVHHTNHDKEYTCFIKRKKRNIHFCSSFALRNLIKLQGSVWHGYVHPRAGRQAVKAAGWHVALPGGGLALGIVTQSHHQSGCSPLAMSSVLQSSAPQPHSLPKSPLTLCP